MKIAVINLITGNIQDELEIGHNVPCMSLSKNNKYLLFAYDDNTCRLFDISKKTVIKGFIGHTNYISCAIFGNNNDIFTASGDKTIKRWNISSKMKMSYSNCIQTYSGHTSEVVCVIYDELNNRLFSSSSISIFCWNVDIGQKIGVMSHINSHTVTSLCFVNPNTIASASVGGDKTVKVWNATTFECLQTIYSHTDWINSVVSAPDGIHIVTGGYDSKVRIWDTISGTRIKTLEYPNNHIYKVAVSSDGRYIVSGGRTSQISITQISPPFTFILYTFEKITLFSDGGLRNEKSKQIYQIQSDDNIVVTNDTIFKIGKCENNFILKTKKERDEGIDYINAVKYQLALDFTYRDYSKRNILSRYRFNMWQTINYNSNQNITRKLMEIIELYALQNTN